MTRPAADPQGHRSPPLPLPFEDAGPPAIPAPPDDLGPVGVEVWNAVWSAGGSAYVEATDRWPIHRYAQFQERRVALLKIVEDEGWTAEGSKGQIIQHPAARVLNDVEGKLVPLEDRLGLSPEARLRLGITAAHARSALDAFLSDDT